MVSGRGSSLSLSIGMMPMKPLRLGVFGSFGHTSSSDSRPSGLPSPMQVCLGRGDALRRKGGGLPQPSARWGGRRRHAGTRRALRRGRAGSQTRQGRQAERWATARPPEARPNAVPPEARPPLGGQRCSQPSYSHVQISLTTGNTEEVAVLRTSIRLQRTRVHDRDPEPHRQSR